jgi:glutathione S-transferase
MRQTKAADVPRYPVIRSYIDRICDRPAFKKAYADQVAHFIAGDEARRNH